MERLVTVAKIIEHLGSIKGEKSLQKMIYLVDSYGGRLGYQFDFQQYGPISFQLQQDIHEICALGLISIRYEDNVPIYSAPSSLDHLRQFWRDKHENHELQPVLTDLLTFFEHLQERNNPEFLEILASLDYSQHHELIQPLAYDTHLHSIAKSTLDNLHHQF